MKNYRQRILQYTNILKNHQSTEEQKTGAANGIRYILWHNDETTRVQLVHEVDQAGTIPLLVKCLDGNTQPLVLIFQALCALLSITATRYAGVVVQNRAVPPLTQLLRHFDTKVREGAALCLGNIASDNFCFRDLLLQSGKVLPALLENMRLPGSMHLLNNVTWAVYNLCAHEPFPNLALLNPAIPVLNELFALNVSVEIKFHAAHALLSLSKAHLARSPIFQATHETDLRILQRYFDAYKRHQETKSMAPHMPDYDTRGFRLSSTHEDVRVGHVHHTQPAALDHQGDENLPPSTSIRGFGLASSEIENKKSAPENPKEPFGRAVTTVNSRTGGIHQRHVGRSTRKATVN